MSYEADLFFSFYLTATNIRVK